MRVCNEPPLHRMNVGAASKYLRTLHRPIFRAIAMHGHVHANVDAHARIDGRRRGHMLMLLAIALIVVVIDRIISGRLRL